MRANFERAEWYFTTSLPSWEILRIWGMSACVLAWLPSLEKSASDWKCIALSLLEFRSEMNPQNQYWSKVAKSVLDQISVRAEILPKMYQVANLPLGHVCFGQNTHISAEIVTSAETPFMILYASHDSLWVRISLQLHSPSFSSLTPSQKEQKHWEEEEKRGNDHPRRHEDYMQISCGRI